MKLQRFHRYFLPALVISSAISLSAMAQVSKNNVSPAVRLASDLGPVESSQQINITVQLKSPNQAAFDKVVEALYDPSSPTYHHWLSDQDLQKYAPPKAQLEAVSKELESHGLSILSTDANGFSVRARGSAGNVETAFHTSLHNFQRNGKTFRANVQNASLNGTAGSYVAAVSGLESRTVQPLIKRALNAKTNQPFAPKPLASIKALGGLGSVITNQILLPPAVESLTTPGASLPIGVYYGNVYNGAGTLIPDYTAAQLEAAYGLTSAYKQGLNGAGQTIVLLEAYGYPDIEADANAFSTLNGLPQLTSSNFKVVYPEGQPASSQAGVLTGWNTEIALDVQWAHAIAPGAKIVVVAAAGQDNEDFQDAISYITNHKLGTAVSDSWEVDTDLIAGPLEQQSYDLILEKAAAKGISFQFSTGDGGDEGLGTPEGAPGVPSVSPHATAVGGTAILNTPGGSGLQTVGWGDTLGALDDGAILSPPVSFGLLGGSGGGESVYWPKPSWQSSLPGTGRQTPDVSALADPYTGVPIVLTVNGVQELEAGWGGTSLASPIFTAIWAIATQKAGKALGQAAPLIASLRSGGIQDVLPTVASSATNPAGTVFTSSGPTYYDPAAPFAGSLYTTTGFLSGFLAYSSSLVYDFGFGIDSSLTVTPGWDNVTGYGTPKGLSFINAVAAAK